MNVKSIFKLITLFVVGVLALTNCTEKKGWRGRPFLHISSADLAPWAKAFDDQYAFNQHRIDTGTSL